MSLLFDSATDSLSVPRSSRKPSRPERAWLLAIAAATVLSFGVRPQTAARAIFWWTVRLGGASCAVAVLCRTPKPDRYDPIADLTTTHRFQMTRLQEQHREELLQLQFQKLDEIAQLQAQLENQQQHRLNQAIQLVPHHDANHNHEANGKRTRISIRRAEGWSTDGIRTHEMESVAWQSVASAAMD